MVRLQPRKPTTRTTEKRTSNKKNVTKQKKKHKENMENSAKEKGSSKNVSIFQKLTTLFEKKDFLFRNFRPIFFNTRRAKALNILFQNIVSNHHSVAFQTPTCFWLHQVPFYACTSVSFPPKCRGLFRHFFFWQKSWNWFECHSFPCKIAKLNRLCEK